MFFKNDEAEVRGPSRVHIRFEAIERILPAEKSVMLHTIYINGKPAAEDCNRIDTQARALAASARHFQHQYK